MFLPKWPKIGKIDKQKKEYKLDNMQKILSLLGNPQNNVPPTIHIAGTNGKGSTHAILKSILESANFKVHAYTSPHIIHFNERIYLAGNYISDAHIESLLDEIKLVSEKNNIEISFFEAVTIAAFMAFSKIDADILLLETGLGGLLDATNLVGNKILSIITTISYDHMDYLGDDIINITRNKAGIIKSEVPCVVGKQHWQEVYSYLFEVCDNNLSSCYSYEYDYSSNIIDNNYFEYVSEKYKITFPNPNLLGEHQVNNAATAIASLLLLNNLFPQEKKINTKHITSGLKNIKWFGRLEKINPKQYSHLLNFDNDKLEIYIDGAHNEDGAKALSYWLEKNITEPIYLILGMTNNRDVSSFCKVFPSYLIKSFVSVPVLSEPSSYSADGIKNILQSNNIHKVLSYDSLENALDGVMSHHKNDPATNDTDQIKIMITGSLFLISDFAKLINYDPLK